MFFQNTCKRTRTFLVLSSSSPLQLSLGGCFSILSSKRHRIHCPVIADWEHPSWPLSLLHPGYPTLCLTPQPLQHRASGQGLLSLCSPCEWGPLRAPYGLPPVLLLSNLSLSGERVPSSWGVTCRCTERYSHKGRTVTSWGQQVPNKSGFKKQE